MVVVVVVVVLAVAWAESTPILDLCQSNSILDLSVQREALIFPHLLLVMTPRRRVWLWQEPVGVGRDHVGETATVQAGMTLLEIHEWLGKQGKEVRTTWPLSPRCSCTECFLSPLPSSSACCTAGRAARDR